LKKTTGKDQSIRTTLQGATATYLTVACVQEDLFQVACYAPLRIPEGSRRDIAEALVRANYGLRVGKFEMDFDGGEHDGNVSAGAVVGGVWERGARGGDSAGGEG